MDELGELGGEASGGRRWGGEMKEGGRMKAVAHPCPWPRECGANRGAEPLVPLGGDFLFPAAQRRPELRTEHPASASACQADLPSEAECAALVGVTRGGAADRGMGGSTSGVGAGRRSLRRGGGASAGRRALQLLVASGCCSMLSLSAPSSSALPSSSSHGLPLPARPPPTAPSPGAAGIHSLRRGGAVGASDGRQGRSEVMRLSGGGWGASSDGLGERRESQRDARAKELEV
ncbi:hypothetical protein T484DRAFT_1919353 [Baffinella frigidus]|nr:hypothetical protein T484DRAFT_1919353 [Cryptophyta sp. CCMP2293]